jgi:hypothetical protein
VSLDHGAIRYQGDLAWRRYASRRLSPWMMHRLVRLTLLLPLLLTACSGDVPDGPRGVQAGNEGTASPSAERATPATVPQEPTRCVHGWITPDPGSRLRARPLEVIRRTMELEDGLVVEEMRYFEGPESPPSEQNYLEVVRRWYVKGFLKAHPSIRGRWIVEQRRFGAGVAAVAPYDTTGFRSPDWLGFQYDSTDPTARAYPGLPGKWSGIAYDFVTGGAGLEISGLPADVVGCLTGT